MESNSGREGTLGCSLHQSPQFYFNFFLFIASKILVLLLYFDWLVHSFECPNVSTIIVIYRRGNLVYHYWECTPIYRSLSYPFRLIWNLTSLLTFVAINATKQLAVVRFLYARLTICSYLQGDLFSIWFECWGPFSSASKLLSNPCVLAVLFPTLLADI